VFLVLKKLLQANKYWFGKKLKNNFFTLKNFKTVLWRNLKMKFFFFFSKEFFLTFSRDKSFIF
jgi:hypothetical protein